MNKWTLQSEFAELCRNFLYNHLESKFCLRKILKANNNVWYLYLQKLHQQVTLCKKLWQQNLAKVFLIFFAFCQSFSFLGLGFLVSFYNYFFLQIFNNLFIRNFEFIKENIFCPHYYCIFVVVLVIPFSSPERCKSIFRI